MSRRRAARAKEPSRLSISGLSTCPPHLGHPKATEIPIHGFQESYSSKMELGGELEEQAGRGTWSLRDGGEGREGRLHAPPSLSRQARASPPWRGVVSKAWRTPRNSRFTPINQPLLRCLVSVLGNSCMLFQKIIITMLREALLCLQLAMQSAHFHRTETSRTICLFSRTLTFPILPFNK